MFKKIIYSVIFLSLMSSFSVFAKTEISAENVDSELRILDLVVGVERTYSKASQLDAKIFEILAGDGLNPTRMILIFSNGMEDSKIFQLQELMYKVDRVVFSDIDTIVINFTQDSIDEEGNNIQLKRSIEVKIGRDTEGKLADKIFVKNLK
jgi:hypothetical protein